MRCTGDESALGDPLRVLEALESACLIAWIGSEPEFMARCRRSSLKAIRKEGREVPVSLGVGLDLPPSLGRRPSRLATLGVRPALIAASPVGRLKRVTA